MTRIFAPITVVLWALPARAQDYEPGYGFTSSLFNTDFVVLIGFLLFLAILFYFEVPGRLAGMLDARAAQIRADLDEARSLRDEAQALLADYERKAAEVSEQAERIVAGAREDAEASAEQARRDLETSIERRIRAAEEQIGNAEARAVRQVRDRAVEVAVAAAADILARQTGEAERDRMIDNSIEEVGRRLN